MLEKGFQLDKFPPTVLVFLAYLNKLGTFFTRTFLIPFE